ncbi:hypothetical protein [Lacipirellula parvula]|uniref:Uncharacterized protein n=1 Tax=Lacipirellula parvula TaxID=2650471 RepID=A0A5K7XBS2_9BACT|nr:hypothetical protein [Lacipirellula parvula]BBO33958.1 hypothetical protein PLANPX_3570 [Lacipirellula parvula]
MRRIVASLVVLLSFPALALAQLNPLNYSVLDNGLGLNPILSGTATASIVTTSTSATFTYGTTVYNAVMTPQVSGPDIAVFTFSNINLGGLATALTITGTNPVALLSQQNIVTIPIAINGGNANAGVAGTAGVGGGAGGTTGHVGVGTTAGGAGVSGGGGGGGFGGAGGTGAGTGGGVGGAANVGSLVIGGSGGGGGGFSSGGGGGGGLEIGAVNSISLGGTVAITANGGNGSAGGAGNGGGGSGGLIYIHGKQVIPLASQTISANGGTATNQGGGGGGGKIIIDGLQNADPNSRGVPIETTFTGTVMQAKGGASGTGGVGGAGSIVLNPSLPIVTNLNITLDGQPITLNGTEVNSGARVTYIIQRDLQVGTNQNGVQPGQAQLAVNEPLAADAKLSIMASGVFKTNAFKQTVAKLTGNGKLQLDAGGTVSISNSSTIDFDFTGSIEGTGTLEKAGSGTLIRRTNLLVPGTVNNAAGTLAIEGATVKADTAFTNAVGATLKFDGLGSSIVSPTLTNAGQIVGSGSVAADLTNQPTGTIRLLESDSQLYTGAVNTNSGNISLLGGVIQFTNPVTNSAVTGGMSGRGTMIFGGTGLTNDGFLAFSGGNSDILGDVTNNAGGAVSTVGRSVSSFYGDFVNQGTVLTATGATTVFLATQTGGGSFTGGGTVEYFGPIVPGNSPAMISYGGNVVFGPAATLKIELGGTTRGSKYDALNIAGNLAADGALAVSLINGFVPSIGQTFDILNWGSLTGGFSSITLPSLPGRAWDTSQLYQSGTLRVVAPTVSGDFDGNGFVDSGDLVGWKSNFGITSGATRAQGDADGDGDVDGADFMAWQQTFGQTVSTPVAAAVPEASGLTLALLAMLGGVAMRRR